MGPKSWSDRYEETSHQDTGDLEAIREARLEDGQDVGVIDQVLADREADDEAQRQDWEDQHNL